MAQSTTSLSSAIVSLHALSCGHFTLPEYQFVQPSSLEARRTVPSLSFLIQHENSHSGRITRILFDLGLRKDIRQYSLPIQRHTENRRPITTYPDVTENLARGGLTPNDIDYVIYSHVHWDHVGEPRDFPSSIFVVGHGSLALLAGTSSKFRGGHSFFEPDLLPNGRLIELTDPVESVLREWNSEAEPGILNFDRPWHPNGMLPHTLDLFNDGSLLIVDAPGHLPGHINLLVQTSNGHQIYLGGDVCHDRRLLTGEKEIGEWIDAEGYSCCIHADRGRAEEVIKRVRALEREGVEIILAHDVEWENEPMNMSRFFGAG